MYLPPLVFGREFFPPTNMVVRLWTQTAVFGYFHGKAGSCAVSAASDANNNSFVAVFVISELRVPNTLCICDTGCCTNSLLRTLFMHLDEFIYLFYIHGSVHRDSVLIRYNKMQQYAGIYLLQVYSTCFGRPSRPSSGVQKTVTAASGTGRFTVTMTCTRGCGHSFL